MTKVKQHSRQIFVILLALATAVTGFFIMSSKVDAANSGYYYRVVFEVTYARNASVDITVSLKDDNGYGSTPSSNGSKTLSFGKSETDSTGTYTRYPTSSGWSSTESDCVMTAAGCYPTGLSVYHKINSYAGFSSNFKFKCYLQIKNASGTWVSICSTDEHTGKKSKDDNETWTNNPTTKPKASSWSINTDDVSVTTNAKGGGTKTVGTYSATNITDQFGTSWVHTAPAWSITTNLTGTSITSSSGSSTTVKIGETVNNQVQTDETLTVTCGNLSATKKITVIPTYKLTFNKNGGTLSGSSTTTTTNTSPSSTTVTQDVSGTTASRTGYDFLGWSTSQGDTGTEGSKTTISGLGYDATVYAVWKAHTYKLHFDGNGATAGSMSDQTVTYDDRSSYTGTAIKNNLFTREYTVSYDGNEGTVGSTSDDNTKAAYTFDGWHSEPVNDIGTYSGVGIGASGTTSSYNDIIRWTVSPDFAAGDVYKLEFDAYGAGKLTTYFYGASDFLKVASSSTTGSDGYSYSGNSSDGNVPYTLNTSWTHYTTYYTLGNNGNGSVEKYLLFRAFDEGDSVNFKNVRFMKDSAVQYANQATVRNLTSTDNAVINLAAAWTPDSVVLPSATRTAYDFDGWWTEAVGGTKIGDEGDAYTPDASVTLYAHWTPKTYTITLKDGYSGTTVGEPIEYTILTTNITYPNVPTRTGCTFNGIYTVQSDAGNWHAGETLTNNSSTLSGKYGNVILNAGWTPNPYKVTYKAVSPSVCLAGEVVLLNGRAEDVEVTYTYSTSEQPHTYSEFGMPELTIPTGYTFGGWYYDAELHDQFMSDNEGEAAVQIADNYTVWPKWEPITYSITYILNDNGDANTTFTGVNPQTFNITDTFSVASASRLGYGNAVWQVVGDVAGTYWADKIVVDPGNPAQSEISMAYGNVTLSALWAKESVKVVYAGLVDGRAVDAYNNDVAETYSSYDEPIGDLATGARNGYRFDGWFMKDGTNGDWGAQVTAATVYNAANGFNTTPYVTYIYAKWTPRTYTVAFDRNGDGTGSMDTQSFTYDEAAKSLSRNKFGKTGYDFLGWALSRDATTPDYTDEQQIRINGLLTDEQKNLDNVTVTLYAVWAKHKYTVTWQNVDGSTIDTTLVEYQAHPSHSIPSYIDDMYNYTFRAWTKNGVDVDLATEEITADCTYTAAYTTSAKTYNLIYRAAGEGETAILYTDPYEYNTQTSVRAVPERTGYTGEWIIIDPVDLQTLPTLMPAHNITLKAVYTPIKYLITWDLGAGVTQTQRCDYDSVPVYSGTPTRPDDAMYKDYSFIGWSATGEDGAVLESLPVVKGDATYYAVYDKTPVDYEIYWYQDYEDAEHNISHHLTPIVTVVPYGTTITDDMIPAITPVAGCAVAWDIAALPQTMPAEDVYIEAVYRYGARNIYWHNGATTASTVQMDGEYVKYTGATPVKAATAEYSYEFIGWAGTENGDVIFDSRENDTSTIAVEGVNIDFYAVFEPHAKEYTVSYYVDGGVNRQFTVAYGEVVPSYPVPAKEGHTGLWGEIPDTMPAHDVTIEASYSKNSYRVTWVAAGRVITTYSEYGDKPVFPADESKEKAADAQYTYSFAGWATVAEAGSGDLVYSDAQIPPIGAADVEYYAQYGKTVNSYTVTWKVDEDASHDITAVYDYGVLPEAPPASATARPSDAQYDYTFIRWDKEISPVEGDTTYIAQYDKQIKSYVVKWIIRHGNVDIAEVSETYEYGRYPIYTGTAIQDYEDAGYDYVYEGDWATVPGGEATDDLPAVTKDVTYYCHFKQIPKQFYIEWIVDGEVLDSGLFNYGEAFPQRDIPQKEGYSGSWNVSDRTVPARDVTVTAQYKANKYPVVFIGQNGIVLYSDYLYYGDAIPAVEIPPEQGYTLAWDQPEITTVPVNGVTFNLIRTINTYTLRWKNDNNDTGTVTADYHTEINVTVSAPIPEEMVVIIGDVTATEGTEFTYDPATGALKVFAQYVTADINAYSKARGNSYNVYIQIPDVEIAAAQAVVEAGGTYYARLTAMEGKLVPAAVTVYVDGEPLTRGYEYLVEQGGKAARLAIDGTAVTGTVTVEGEVRDDPNYGQNNGGNSGNNSGNSGSTSAECPYCHGHHEGFLGVIISFFHRIMYFFKSIFG